MTCLLLLPTVLSACGTSKPEPSLPPASETAPIESEANRTFGKILWDACQLGVLPDGTMLDYAGPEAAAQNEFALFDVDGDGQEELLLYWTHASMAGTQLSIFGCSNEDVYTEATVFPTAEFYSSGVIVSAWSHNQGLAGDRFWPYSIYLHDAETDTYTMSGAADAWNHELISENFPDDIDADGDGLVYFLLPGEEAWNYVDNHPAYPPIDGKDHELWRDSFLSGAHKLEIRTQKLTEQNISALGCPKPEIPVTEPLG